MKNVLLLQFKLLAESFSLLYNHEGREWQYCKVLEKVGLEIQRSKYSPAR